MEEDYPEFVFIKVSQGIFRVDLGIPIERGFYSVPLYIINTHQSTSFFIMDLKKIEHHRQMNFSLKTNSN